MKTGPATNFGARSPNDPSLGSGLIEKISGFVTPGPGRLINRDGFSHSAVLMPLVEIDGFWHLLFEKRAQNIRQGGELCFPGGRVEKSETRDPASTVLRETCEELGICGDQVRLTGCLGTLVAPAGAAIDVFVGVIGRDAVDTMNPDPREVEKAILWPLARFMEGPPEFHSARIQVSAGYESADGSWVELLPVRKLGLPERYQGPWGVRDHRILVYRLDTGRLRNHGGPMSCAPGRAEDGDIEILWGLTAEMVFGFCCLLADGEGGLGNGSEGGLTQDNEGGLTQGIAETPANG